MGGVRAIEWRNNQQGTCGIRAVEPDAGQRRGRTRTAAEDIADGVGIPEAQKPICHDKPPAKNVRKSGPPPEG